MKLNLQYFAGGHSVTCYKDAHTTTFSASSTSDVQANATVTLTVTPASGYELDEIEVITGGVTVKYESSAYTFKMGSDDVVLYMKTKANNKYIVVEDTDVNINGSATHLAKNIKLQQTANGGVCGVTVSGTAITFDAAVVAQLVADGVLVKI